MLQDMERRDKQKAKRMVQFILYILTFCLIIGVLFIPKLLSGCEDEECFRKKYNVGESIGTLIKMELRGSSTTAKYEYRVDGKTYTLNKPPIGDFEQEGDQFIVLYDKADPENSIVLRHRSVKPEGLIRAYGIITYFKKDEQHNIVIVKYTYVVEGHKVKRLEFFPIEKSQILEELYKQKNKVSIDVVSENANRAFLNLDDSQKVSE